MQRSQVVEWLAFVGLSSANVVGAFVAPRAPKPWERALLALAFSPCSLAAVTAAFLVTTPLFVEPMLDPLGTWRERPA